MLAEKYLNDNKKSEKTREITSLMLLVVVAEEAVARANNISVLKRGGFAFWLLQAYTHTHTHYILRL